MTRPLSLVGAASGFTLIELVVGLLILSMVTLLSAEALRFGTRSWGSGERLLDDSDEIAVAQLTLRRILEGALPAMPASGSIANTDLGLHGMRDSIRLTAVAPIASGGAHWMAYRIASSATSTKSDLAVSWTPSTRGVAHRTSTPEAPEVLLQGIARAEFSYWSPASGWQDQWQDPRHNPGLVRVEVAFLSGDRRRWTDLVIRPRLTAPPNCHFDLVGLQCR